MARWPVTDPIVSEPQAGREAGGARGGIAVILPVLNEAGRLEQRVADLAGRGFDEIIVVDGGSEDGSGARVAALAARLAHAHIQCVQAPAGRAVQMNAGAARARAEILLFLHVDTELPPYALSQIRDALAAGARWGRFDVRLDAGQPVFRLIERMMNWRSHWSGIATGDQAIFMSRATFQQVGGYAAIPLMEDIELSGRLKRLGRPARVRVPVVTSARRWQRGGVVRTIVLMWGLRLAYWLGVDPARLARFYRLAR